MSYLTQLFDLVGELARRRYRVGERAFASLGLNHTEARLLTLLDLHGGTATQEALSNMLTIDRSNAGRALKKLEQAGYVERRRDAGDGRTNEVHTTDRGRSCTADIVKLRGQIAQEFFGELTEADADKVIALLQPAMRSGEPVAKSCSFNVSRDSERA